MDSQNTNFAGTRANDSFDNSSSNYNNSNMNNRADLSDNYSSSNNNNNNSMNANDGFNDNSRNTNYSNMNSSADYNNMDNTNSTFSDNTLDKTDTTGYAADNNRSNFNDGVSQSNTTPSTNTDSFDRDNVTRETAPRESERINSENRDSTTSDMNQDDVPKKGIAGVIHSNFGADKTTTSTFEKSQGEKYGENFDETGAQIKGRFSVDETAAASGSATGGGDYSMGGKQGANAGMDTNMPNKHDGTQKESFGQKLKDKAEGMMHRHHHE